MRACRRSPDEREVRKRPKPMGSTCHLMHPPPSYFGRLVNRKQGRKQTGRVGSGSTDATLCKAQPRGAR